MSIINNPLHPGEIVKSTLIDATGLTVTEAAEQLDISRTALSQLINCHTNLSPQMALRLSILLGTSVDMWINLQAQYDTWNIKHQDENFDIQPLKKKSA